MEAEFCIFIVSERTAKFFDKKNKKTKKKPQTFPVSWPQEAFVPFFE